jgi:2Fe-2S ferredoxin
MTLAVDNMVEGVVGECGGAMACATCHSYIDSDQQQYFAPISELEESMLEMAPNRQANSRLSCQLELSESTPDIEIHLPESQY